MVAGPAEASEIKELLLAETCAVRELEPVNVAIVRPVLGSKHLQKGHAALTVREADF